MASWHAHWFLDCPQHHLIPIPAPRPNSKDALAHMAPTDNPVLNILCHECGTVYGYCSALPRTGTQRDEADPFAAGGFRFAATQVGCDGGNCVAPKTIHAVLENNRGVWRLGTQPENWQFSDTACCGAGHRLHLPKGSRILWETVHLFP